MYKAWPFFRVTLDMIAMVVAKADATTVKLYEEKLVRTDLKPIGADLRKAFHLARESLLSIIGNKSVLGSGASCRVPICLLTCLGLALLAVTGASRSTGVSPLAVTRASLAMGSEGPPLVPSVVNTRKPTLAAPAHARCASVRHQECLLLVHTWQQAEIRNAAVCQATPWVTAPTSRRFSMLHAMLLCSCAASDSLVLRRLPCAFEGFQILM